MPTNPSTVRGPRPIKILWKWTAVSTLLHVLFVALLCGISYLGYQKKLAASAARVAAEEAAAQKVEAERAAKATATPAPAAAPAPAPAPAPTPQPEPVHAEKVLGIDKVATPAETPSSPFARGDDDLLKDLK